jgi:hypothetical protein
MKANKTMSGQAVSNRRRRKDQESESSTDLHNSLNNKMTGITTYISILTLNVKEFNYPIKRHLLENWIKKEVQTISCIQDTHCIDRNKHWLKVKDWKKIYQANGP